jgi:hypothetical protein
MRRISPRRAAVALLALAAVLLAAGCAGGARPVSIASLRWIIGQENLGRLHADAPDLTRELLASKAPVVVRGPSGDQVPAGATPAELFKSYEVFTGQLRAGAISPEVRAVVYDPESWSYTPAQERHDPMRYLALFSQAARAHGYRPILAPGRDLTLTPGGRCEKRRGERVGQAYVRCGIPAAAQGAAIFVIQAAPQELDLPALHRLVEASSRQARRANPDVVLIATISSAPGGVAADPAAMAAAARTMLPYVQGFMLNMTKATTPNAVAFLRALATGQG